MNDREQHVQWIIGQARRKGYTEFAKAIQGVLQKDGYEEAFKYIQINAAVQQMLLDEWGGDKSA